MKWSDGSLLAGAVVIGMLCIPSLVAASESMASAGGRITFSGAVVAPTCVSAREPVVSAFTVRRRFACESTTPAARSSPSSYELSVALLERERTAGDPLLAYFTGYLSPVARDAARLVTRTYQ